MNRLPDGMPVETTFEEIQTRLKTAAAESIASRRKIEAFFDQIEKAKDAYETAQKLLGHHEEDSKEEIQPSAGDPAPPSPPPLESPQPQWHYSLDGTPHGPVPESELKALLADGTLSGATPLWHTGLEEWTRAAVLGLAPPPVKSTDSENRQCVSCGQANRADAKFCRSCGTPMSKGPPPLQVENRTCPGCHQPVESTARFCSACGHQL